MPLVWHAMAGAVWVVVLAYVSMSFAHSEEVAPSISDALEKPSSEAIADLSTLGVRCSAPDVFRVTSVGSRDDYGYRESAGAGWVTINLKLEVPGITTVGCTNTTGRPFGISAQASGRYLAPGLVEQMTMACRFT